MSKQSLKDSTLPEVTDRLLAVIKLATDALKNPTDRDKRNLARISQDMDVRSLLSLIRDTNR